MPFISLRVHIISAVTYLAGV